MKFQDVDQLCRGSALGRCRMGFLAGAGWESLRALLVERVELEATVVTDGWAAYLKVTDGRHVHEPFVITGSGWEAHELPPAVHRVASLAERWLLGTHQGGVEPGHPPAYLDEFTFASAAADRAHAGHKIRLESHIGHQDMICLTIALVKPVAARHRADLRRSGWPAAGHLRPGARRGPRSHPATPRNRFSRGERWRGEARSDGCDAGRTAPRTADLRPG